MQIRIRKKYISLEEGKNLLKQKETSSTRNSTAGAPVSVKVYVAVFLEDNIVNLLKLKDLSLKPQKAKQRGRIR